MRRGPLRALLAALLVGLGLAVVSAHAANQTVTATSSDTFSPAAVTVNQGETVTWKNGGGNHNVSFDDGSFTQPATPSTSPWTVSHALRHARDVPLRVRATRPGHGGHGHRHRLPDRHHPAAATAGRRRPEAARTRVRRTPGTDTTAPVISRFGMTQPASA